MLQNNGSRDDEVGPRFKQIENLCRRLYGEFTLSDERIAPSLIARSECELFCLSAPRFAYRVIAHVNSQARDLPSIINVRRLNWFRTAMANRWSLADEVLEEFVERGNPVADSLFVVPDQRGGDFHVLSCDLAHYYGEDIASHASVPFMQHMPLGGGMCAQACIFMALCLQHRWASSVAGVAELTLLAKQRDRGEKAEEVLLNGLKFHEIADVLRNPVIGMYAPLETVKSLMTSTEKTPGLLAAIWHTYVTSGVPVICVLDSHELAGVRLKAGEYKTGCVWGFNGIEQIRLPEELSEKKEGPHAVLIVGSSRKNERPLAGDGLEDGQFLVNDPAADPMMIAPLALLRKAALKGKDLVWYPVLPPDVRLPLVGVSGGQLIEFARSAQLRGKALSSGRLPGIAKWEGAWPGRIRLIRFADSDWQQHVAETLESSGDIGQADGQGSNLKGRVFGALDAIRETIPSCWLQSLREGGEGLPSQVWIWDASKEAPPVDELSPLLRVFVRQGSTYAEFQ